MAFRTSRYALRSRVGKVTRAVRYVYSTLCQALDQAVDDGAIPRNVAPAATLGATSRSCPATAAQPAAEHTLSPAALRRFLEWRDRIGLPRCGCWAGWDRAQAG